MKNDIKEISSTDGKAIIRGVVDSWDGMTISGWAVSSDSDDVELCILADGIEIKRFIPDQYRSDLYEQKISTTGFSGFKIELNVYELIDKNFSEIEIIECETKSPLVGVPLNIYPSVIKGHIDSQSIYNIIGWCFDKSYPDRNVDIDVYVNESLVTTVTANILRHDLRDAGITSFSSGFSLNVGQYIDHLKLNSVVFKVAGTQQIILDKVKLFPKTARINTFIKLQNIVKTATLLNDSPELTWLTQSIIPELIDKTRADQFAQGDYSFADKTLITNGKNSIDIIVPVYKGIEETINCIQSVYDVNCKQNFNVIVINDCSPEPELTEKLRSLEKILGFNLLENEFNLGFVGTVNKGMKYSETNDVLLLNSDTVVTNHWLDKIVGAAYSDETIGSVTPFSNNATICSYPRFCVDNELPNQIKLNELSEVFATENKNKVVDLPTAHGFSMFIKRSTLKDVGFFDEKKWGKGYAEENDFSLRAARLGWRNVMAMDAFVQHLGSVSFAGNTDEFIATNLRKLNGIYPDYPQAVESFINEDPIRPFRNNVAFNLLQKEQLNTVNKNKENLGSILYVSLTIGGGTEVATNDIAALNRSEGKSVFMLVAPSEKMWELKSLIDNTVVQYKLPEDESMLIKHLKSLKVKIIHYHHTIQFPKFVWELSEQLSVPYEVILHDYHTICPRVNLIDETKSYCGEPNSDACNRCIKSNGVHNASLLSFDDLGGTIDSWRNYYFEKLQGAQAVITPSVDTRDRILKYFDLDNIEARYHPEPEFIYEPISLIDGKVLNIAFIGAIGIHKGLNVLKECAKYAYKFNLPVKFIVIGYTSDDEYFKELPNVTITGKYKKEELPELFKIYDCHVAGLFSVWPETFSYTLSEALRANLKIAAFNLGAINERCAVDYLNEIGTPSNVIMKNILGIN